jgi:hypothetical protein
MKTLAKIIFAIMLAAILLCGLAACENLPETENIKTENEQKQEQSVYWDDEGIGWNQPVNPEPTTMPDPDAILQLKPDSIIAETGYPLDNEEIYVRTYGLGTHDTGWPFYGQIFDIGSRGFQYEDTPERVVAENIIINGTENIGNADLGVSEYWAWNFYIDFAPFSSYEPITSLEATIRVYWEGREFKTYRFVINY